ncbi:restriction endonuclease subunit S [Aeromonas salmonicida]|uniref:restriction endonuclease subunit S n=1 Tax=Aeromonas salmonicida TaxID=645 RepID=UPI00259FAF47|nr:restriction endonuclease subunit S [Aeromonas salmonicida]MDM5149149.1 restriction endonuclease subunit S [Aeromonas salmonicida]
MTTRTAMPKYDAYKDSGVEWLGYAPGHWVIQKMKFLFKDTSIKNKAEQTLLSVTQDQGVIPRDWVENRMVMPSGNLESFKYIQEGDFAISLRSFEGGLEYCHHNGIISPAYTVLKKSRDDLVNFFYKYLFKSQRFISELQTSIVGIREGKNISYEELRYSYLPIPSESEQTTIANFLDTKTTQLDEAIAIKVQQVVLLNEHKQILIQQAVTQGLDPNVTMKDSGVEWIGKIPEHWQVKRLKFVLDERSERSLTGEEPLFMVSQQYGLVVRADYHEKAVVAASNIDSKIVYKNDLVFNKLKAHLGVFFKSNIDFKGLVSPDYAVYKIKDYISDTKILELLFRNPLYIEQFTIRATGIVEGLIRLYTSDLFDISIPIAPKEEQLEILANIEKISVLFDNAIELHREQCEKLKEYKTTLINNAVTGKIKVV